MVDGEQQGYKVKHERHTNFEKAALGNVLNSLSALLIANIYFANEMGTLPTDAIPRGLLIPDGLIRPTALGRTDLGFKMPP